MNKLVSGISGGVLLSLAVGAVASPAFDRPGTAFNPVLLEPGSLVWEQGLPDVTRDEVNNNTVTNYAYHSSLRFGVAKYLEVQLSGNPYQELKTSGNDSADGPGNFSLAVKTALPTQSDKVNVGLMASVEFNSGKPWFRNYGGDGEEARSATFGITSSWQLTERQAFTGYLDITRIDKNDVYTFSPSWSFDINDSWGAFVEYKVSFGDLAHNDNLLGGGVTWLLTDKLQLDLYSDFGITDNSTDLEAGFGVSYAIF